MLKSYQASKEVKSIRWANSCFRLSTSRSNVIYSRKASAISLAICNFAAEGTKDYLPEFGSLVIADIIGAARNSYGYIELLARDMSPRRGDWPRFYVAPLAP